MSEAVRKITELVRRLERRCGMGEYNSLSWKDYVNRRLPMTDEDWRAFLSAPPHNIGKLLATAFESSRSDFGSQKVNDEIGGITPYINAFWLWRESKIVYKFGKDVEKALLEDTALAVEDNVPVEALSCLPHKHFFIESHSVPWSQEGRKLLLEECERWGNEMRPSLKVGMDNVLGYVVNLFEQRDKNLRVLPNGYLSMAVVLDGGENKPPFLPCVTFRLPNDGGLHSFLDCLVIDSSGENDEERYRRAVAENYLKPLQLVLYLCAENSVLRPRGAVHSPRKGKKVAIAKTPSAIDVLLPEISHRSFPPSCRGSSVSCGGSGKTMPPHERRAHWHSFWVGGKKGSDKARLVLRWLAPILVHGGVGDRITEVSVRSS